MPMLADRTLMLIVSKADEQHLTLSVVPKRVKEGENAALTTRFAAPGTPAAPAQSTMNLFDSGNESRAEADISRPVCISSVSGAANSQEANDNNNDRRGGEQ